jgi:hypothetical protein
MLRSWQVLVLLLATVAGAGHAESSFVLAQPLAYGRIGAATYDESGERIGGADLMMERLASGQVRVRSESGHHRGAQTIATAELSPVESRPGLRLIFEESRSLDADGRALGVLSVDHVRRVASCRDETGHTQTELELPDGDRVVNVPMNLFFQPLVRGEERSLEFQIFLCRPRPRLVDFEAWAVRRGTDGPIEVRYGPDLGVATALARSVAPKLSFWFEPTAPHPWIAHRIPLYSGGPEVLVVRDGVSSTSIAD